MAPRTLPSFLPALTLIAGLLPAQNPGYTDTPRLPDQEWRVHDASRPHPPVVTPPAAGPAGSAPSDAVVLFDGTDLGAWVGRGGEEAAWTVEGGAMVVNGTGDIRTRRAFGDCQLHVEWATPAEVRGEGQGRGNSGVFLMGMYEVQVLDSHDNVTYADGQAASMYGQFPPLVNASRPPGQWQTYDIVFRAPRFADGELQSPATLTLFHNGVLVHDHRAFLGPTRHRSLPKYSKHAEKLPIALQDHGNPVRFRNIWVREL